MKAAQLIQLLTEAKNLDQGDIGIELEFLVREDLMTERSFRDQVRYNFGFHIGSDPSVEPNSNSFERFYTNCEVNSPKARWSKIAPKLQQLLAYLKRTDVVTAFQTSSTLGYNYLFSPTMRQSVGGGGNYKSKTFRLPRARVPMNKSAGVHLHFDAQAWFGDAEHAKRFVTLFNYWQHNLPSLLPNGRYADEQIAPQPETKGRGSYYARLFNFTTDELEVATDDAMAFNERETQIRQFFRELNRDDRYRALNIACVLNRGDVEFRFLHGTLNYNTISSWFEVLVDLFEFTAKGHSEEYKFNTYLKRHAPNSARFLNQARTQSTKSRDPALQLGMHPRYGKDEHAPKTLKRYFKYKPT